MDYASKMHYQLCFVSILLFVSIGNAKQSLDQEPGLQEVNPGQDVVMLCRIFDKSRNSVCSWQKDGLPISFQKGKYEWAGDRSRGDCSLKIFKADISFDNGKYDKQRLFAK